MKRHSLIGVMLSVAVSAAMLSGCLQHWEWPQESKETSRRQSSAVSKESSHALSSYEITDTSEKFDFSLKNTLSETQIDIYNRFVYMIDDYQTSFTFENVDKDDVKNAYYAVMDDHPEYFWLGRSYNYRTKTWGEQSVISVEPVLYSDDADEIRKAQKQLEKTVKEIVDEAKTFSLDYDKVLYVHDYLVDHASYDKETLDSIRGDDTHTLLIGSTSYGCLVQGKAVCSGYSSAFQLLMQRLGIDCGKVNGTRSSEEGSHQWNFVKLDEEYYFIDVTWDDPVMPDGKEVKTHEYFLISHDDLARTHKPNDELPYPQTTGVRYNYYIYNDLYFERYDFEKIREAALRDTDQNSFTVKFAEPEELEAAVSELIENQRVFEIDGISGGVSYTVSSSGCILSVSY